MGVTPPRPAVFAADKAPAFVELRLDAYKTESGGVWWQSRPKITPRLQLVHTNGAKGEGSIESAINWGNANPALNTHPHYQVDRHRAAKLVPTDRKGIGNKTAPSHRGTHGDVADWSLVIETADAGYPTPGEDGGFIGDQVEMIAQILAYESILHGIPLAYPQQWFEAGTATHTDPFEYPYYTIAKGKVCPGRAKKQEMRAVVLPRAIEIRAAWLDQPQPPIPTPEEDDMAKVIIDYIDPDTKKGAGSFTLDGIPLDGAVIPILVKQGWERQQSSHKFWRAAVEHRNGPHAAAMYADEF